MKFSSVCVGLLALLSPVTAMWSKEDREIFRVRAEIQSAEGAHVTFYSYMGIEPNATPDEIKKGYRKMTRMLHPDKVRQRLFAEKKAAAAQNKKDGKSAKPEQPARSEISKAVKIASQKQGRLTVVNDILRGPGRDRYDHYLANGFPLWKGTDYYYTRYRPGLGTVLTGFFIVVGGGFHYLALYMSWKRQCEFVEGYVKFARDTAWGDVANRPIEPVAPAQPEEPEADAAPIPRNRRERRFMEKQEKNEGKKPTPKRRSAKPAAVTVGGDEEEEVEAGPVGARRRVVAENGRILVVDSLGDVYLEEQDEEGNVNMFLLDPEELLPPTWRSTAVVRVPAWFLSIITSRIGLGSSKSNPSASSKASSENAGNGLLSDEPQNTPDSGSDFEMVDKSVDDIGNTKSSGVQSEGGAKKRKANKKR
ncbi:hypothetical protein Cpir12675_005065 [Ceratocystis pirilliformis]|uniref:J domain-containing protein n=1 Tax=Ceratocystis pirilliformis TaxID=259994 RepID=A0ABR3YS82_9PEZI